MYSTEIIGIHIQGIMSRDLHILIHTQWITKSNIPIIRSEKLESLPTIIRILIIMGRRGINMPKIYIIRISNLITKNIILDARVLDKMEELKMFLLFIIIWWKVEKVHSRKWNWKIVKKIIKYWVWIKIDKEESNWGIKLVQIIDFKDKNHQGHQIQYKVELSQHL